MTINDLKNGKTEQATGSVVLGKGVDSLYLYGDKGLDFERLFRKAEATPVDDEVYWGGIGFQRTKAFMQTYPVSLRYGAFTIFLNRVSMYLQIGSLGFEMRGLAGCLMELCEILHCMADHFFPWLNELLLSRVDVFTDFVYNGDFNPDQFKTRLRRKGIFVSGKEEEGKTFYFGNRSIFCIRLYVKSVEIKYSGKTYLKAEWEKRGAKGDKVWRLEFEFRKAKLERLINRRLMHLDEDILASLWSYGLDHLTIWRGMLPS